MDARAVKKYVSVICISGIMISFASCSIPDVSEHLNQDPMSYTPEQIKTEIMPEIAETFVEALETGDEDKLESLFSVNALADAKSRDWDLGCEYVFDIYEGTCTDIRDYNYSQYESYSNDENFNEIDCICYIETTEKTYRLDWVQVLEAEADDDEIGVYNLTLYEWSEGLGNEGGIFSGIDYPERFSASYIASVLGALGYTNTTTSLDIPLLYLSPNLLENMSDADKEDFAKSFIAINNRNITDRFVQIEDDGDGIGLYVVADIDGVGKCVFFCRCDEEVRNEIISVKITMYEGDMPALSELALEDYRFDGLHEFVLECEAGGIDFSAYPETMAELYYEEPPAAEIEYEGLNLVLVPEIQNPGSSNGDVLGRVEVDGQSYAVTRLHSDYGCDVYLINYKVYVESEYTEGIVDYYTNDADIMFTYHEYRQDGSIDRDIDFSMEMYMQLREYYSEDSSQQELFKVDGPVQNFEIRAESSDGVYDGHITVNNIEGNVVLGSRIVPYVWCSGYVLTDEESAYLLEQTDFA